MKKLVTAVLCLCMAAAMMIPAWAEETPAPTAESVMAADAMPKEVVTALIKAVREGDEKALRAVLKKDLGDGVAVIADVKTFNAVVILPVDKEIYDYAGLKDGELMTIGILEGKKAEKGKAPERDSRYYYLEDKKRETQGKYVVDLSEMVLPKLMYAQEIPEGYTAEMLGIREAGFYDIKNGRCTACGQETDKPEEHILLDCLLQYACQENGYQIIHNLTCMNCGGPMCFCQCAVSLAGEGAEMLLGGSGEYVVAGAVPEKLKLGFGTDAKVEYLCKEKPAETVVPKDTCTACRKEKEITAMVKLNCDQHKMCAECFDKLSDTEKSSHQTALECGHYSCDGRKHSTEIFHSDCPNNPKHHKCEGEDGSHVCSYCGADFTCAEGLQHALCIYCGKPICTAEHPVCDYCGGRMCDGRYHAPGTCNVW